MNNLANMAVNALQVRDFQVRFINGVVINDNVDRLHVLRDILTTYGRAMLAKITFYFHDNDNLFHNIIFRKLTHEDRFIVEFYHTYDDQMRHVEMSQYEKMRDFAAVVNILAYEGGLNNLLTPYVINPFIGVGMGQGQQPVN